VTQVTTSKCDFCANVKREVNHWWKAWVDRPAEDRAAGSPFQVRGTRLVIERAEDEKAPMNAKDICGAACVNLAVERFLSTGTLNP
jgi:hypothetical protein